MPARAPGKGLGWVFPAALSTALLSHRLDVKVQRVDKGYPRATDDVFTGVPLDARNVFLYQGEWTLAAGCCVSRPGLPEPLMALLWFLAWDARVCGEWPQTGHAISPGGCLW